MAAKQHGLAPVIAVAFSLPRESYEFRRLSRRWRQIGLVQIWHIGVGEKIARQKLESYLERTTVSLLISAGFAGGLAPNLNVGDVVIDSHSWQGVRVFHVAKGSMPNMNQIYFGQILTVTDWLHASTAKRLLYQDTSALAVDMESQWIHETCRDRGIRTLTIRSVSDAQQDSFDIPMEVLFDINRQATPLGKLIFHIIRNPSDLRKLLRLFRASNLARFTLASALQSAIQELLSGVAYLSDSTTVKRKWQHPEISNTWCNEKSSDV